MKINKYRNDPSSDESSSYNYLSHEDTIQAPSPQVALSDANYKRQGKATNTDNMKAVRTSDVRYDKSINQSEPNQVFHDYQSPRQNISKPSIKKHNFAKRVFGRTHTNDSSSYENIEEIANLRNKSPMLNKIGEIVSKKNTPEDRASLFLFSNPTSSKPVKRNISYANAYDAVSHVRSIQPKVKISSARSIKINNNVISETGKINRDKSAYSPLNKIIVHRKSLEEDEISNSRNVNLKLSHPIIKNNLVTFDKPFSQSEKTLTSTTSDNQTVNTLSLENYLKQQLEEEDEKRKKTQINSIIRKNSENLLKESLIKKEPINLRQDVEGIKSEIIFNKKNSDFSNSSLKKVDPNDLSERFSQKQPNSTIPINVITHATSSDYLSDHDTRNFAVRRGAVENIMETLTPQNPSSSSTETDFVRAPPLSKSIIKTSAKERVSVQITTPLSPNIITHKYIHSKKPTVDNEFANYVEELERGYKKIISLLQDQIKSLESTHQLEVDKVKKDAELNFAKKYQTSRTVLENEIESIKKVHQDGLEKAKTKELQFTNSIEDAQKTITSLKNKLAESISKTELIDNSQKNLTKGQALEIFHRVLSFKKPVELYFEKFKYKTIRKSLHDYATFEQNRTSSLANIVKIIKIIIIRSLNQTFTRWSSKIQQYRFGGSKFHLNEYKISIMHLVMLSAFTYKNLRIRRIYWIFQAFKSLLIESIIDNIKQDAKCITIKPNLFPFNNKAKNHALFNLPYERNFSSHYVNSAKYNYQQDSKVEEFLKKKYSVGIPLKTDPLRNDLV